IVGYFYGNRLIKVTLEETVKKETKGLYRAKIGTLYYGIFGGNLYIRNFSLLPDSAVYNAMDPDSAPSMLLSLNVNNLTVQDIHLKKALFSRRIEVKRIVVNSPELKLWRKKVSIPDTTGKIPDTTQSIPLPKGWDYISVGKINLRTGSLTYIDQVPDTVKEFVIPSIDIQLVNLWVDSTWKTDPRIYNTDDIVVILRDIRQQTGNGMYAMLFGEVGISTGQNLLYVDRFHLEPLFNRHDFSRKLGYQTDRMDVHAGKITLSGIDWRELMLDKRLVAGKLQIDSLELDDYRDKRVPMRPGFKPPMPQQLIRNLKTYIWIDSLELINGKATYSEQVAEEPGTIFFDRIHGILKGLTNDSAWLAEKKTSSLVAEAYLQGSGKLQATINFVFGDPMNRFSIPSALLTSFELPKVNPMLSKLMPAEIESGIVSKLVIHGIQFNDNYSRGSLTLYYNNLSFKIFDEKRSTWSGIKIGVINWLASDIVVAKSNPGPQGKLRTGVIYFQRDKHKSIINFIWKSMLSGLKSTMGFNTKEQKEIKKSSARRGKNQ
ncbi:MAG: hypothetical protein ABIK52_04720, partial [Bacteroidota bacterium]